MASTEQATQLTFSLTMQCALDLDPMLLSFDLVSVNWQSPQTLYHCQPKVSCSRQWNNNECGLWNESMRKIVYILHFFFKTQRQNWLTDWPNKTSSCFSNVKNAQNESWKNSWCLIIVFDSVHDASLHHKIVEQYHRSPWISWIGMLNSWKPLRSSLSLFQT